MAEDTKQIKTQPVEISGDDQKMFDEFEEDRSYFLYYLKPNYDKYYKMFASYPGDRAEDLEKIYGKENVTWQSNVFVPLVFSYCKQFLQKSVGVSPDYNIKGTNADSLKAAIDVIIKYRMMMEQVDYYLQCFIFGWTIGKDFGTTEDVIGYDSVVNGENGSEKLVRTKKVKKSVFWPDFGVVSVYSFFYSPRQTSWTKQKMRKFQRYVLSYEEVLKQYPDLDESSKAMLVDEKGNPYSQGDATDYEFVKKQVMEQVIKSVKNTTKNNTQGPSSKGSAADASNPVKSYPLYEIIECEDGNGDKTVFIPKTNKILKRVVNPYDHGETQYQPVKFFPKPFSIEGMGIPQIIMGLQELLNSDVNKIEDQITMRIGGMIVAAPAALPGYDQRGTFVSKPMGIIWSSDPQSVQMKEWGDVKVSVFNNVEKIQSLMRQAIGLDEYSAQDPGSVQAVTVASYMREATIEGVKLFLYLLQNAYTFHFDHYISMIKQFWDKRSVVPDRVLAEIDDFSDTDFPVKEEDWINPGTKEHKLWPGLYTCDVDQASTLASSSELRSYKDKQIWDMVKDMDDTLTDPDSGTVYTIKKFKVLMKVLEDSAGWNSDEYISKQKKSAVALETVPQPGETGASATGEKTDNNNAPIAASPAGSTGLSAALPGAGQ